MVVAILTPKRADITGLTALVDFEEWSCLVFFLWLAVAGAGPLSLDALVARFRGRQAAEAAFPSPRCVPDVEGRPMSDLPGNRRQPPT